MKRIAYFTTNKEFEIPDNLEGIALYVFYIKDKKEVEYFLRLTDIVEYVIDLSIEELMERLCL